MDQELNEYDELKNELKLIFEVKSKATIFRAECNWVENGEKATKYFFNLEKKNYNRKVINEIEAEEGASIKDNKQILAKIGQYYSDLYRSKILLDHPQESFNKFTQNVKMPKLSDEEKVSLEGYLTFEECQKILETLPNEKSPGEDGFTAELDLVEGLNGGYDIEQLSISQRRGVITLLPKGDESLTHLYNWRPITLLNVDYKIASKAIAKRIEPILNKLVHSDQTGFVKRRYIGENIRLISDIMEQTKKLNSTWFLISVDFQKAFDSLEWSCIQSALEGYNFGEGIVKWIQLFYKDIESAVMNNGCLTS